MVPVRGIPIERIYVNQQGLCGVSPDKADGTCNGTVRLRVRGSV